MARRRWDGAVAWIIAALMVLAGVGASAQETMQVVQNMPGFKPEMSYQDFGKGESVNLSNGNLVVSHPSAISLPQNMGGLLQITRVYNTKDPDKPWIWGISTDPTYGCLGKGWTLSLGRVFVRVVPHQIYGASNYQTRAYYFYMDESGAEHKLYRDTTMENWNDSGSPPANPASSSWYFTSDGSYLRAKYTLGTGGGTWAIYYPDGSIRTAGGTDGSSYVQPTPGGKLFNISPSDGSYYYRGITNQHSCGWFVTQITDRAGNSIGITYKTYSPGSNYAGSIDTITDRFLDSTQQHYRTIVFGYDGSGFLQTMTSGSRIEHYYVTTPSGLTTPVLTLVQDPAGLQTRYGYINSSSDPGYGLAGEIDYPTGAISQYTYATYTYTYCYYWANPGQAECDSVETSGTVATHTIKVAPLNPSSYPNADQNAAKNQYTWTYDRNLQGAYYPITNPETGQIRNHKTRPLVVIDPLGTYAVHFFGAQDNQVKSGQVSGGKEVQSVRYAPGTYASIDKYDPNSPYTGRVSQTDYFYDYGDRYYNGSYYGDTKRCLEDGPLAPQPNWEGNSRVWKTIEGNYLGTPWTKTTFSQGWDGFGHYWLTQTSGTNLSDTRVTVQQYDIKKDMGANPLYQLDRVTLSYTGGMTSQGLRAMMLPVGEDPPDPSGSSFYGMGQFKGVKSTYYSNGLLNTQVSTRKIQPDVSLTLDSLIVSPQTPVSDGANKTLTLTYSEGNITSAKYTGGDSAGKNYEADFTWDHGMVNWMKWIGTGISYPEFTRSIDANTSRISSHSDANGLTTSFSYDADGRITTIQPPGGEYAIRVAYPTETTSGWTTGHRIQYYKGASASIPALTPGQSTSVSGFGTQDLYTDYLFDDLGRLWRTDNVLPDGTWSEKTTFYDPLGRAVFTSEPYAYGSTGTFTPTLRPAGFTLAVPSKSNLPFGTWDTFYMPNSVSDTLPSLTNPFPTGTTGRPIEPFYRTARLIKADGAATTTSYNGLSYTVSLKEINAAPGSGGGLTSSTTYATDVIGRQLSVTPQVGATAAYTYDGLGNVIQVALTGTSTQTRSFTYDALGHLTEFTQPETGRWYNYKYDAIGDILAYTDGKTQTFSNEYDYKGRLHTSSLGSTTWLSNTYDQGTNGLGKLSSSVQSQLDAGSTMQAVTLGITYRGAAPGIGQLDTATETTSLYSAPTLSYQLTYNYQGQVATQTITPSTGGTITNAYAHGAELTRTLDTTALISSMTYNAAGALAAVVMNNGFREQVAYDTYNRPSGFQLDRSNTAIWKSGSFVSSSYPYSYDGAGNIRSIGSMNGSTPPGTYRSDTFTYDALSRLTAASIYKSPSQSHLYAYQYDAFGNLTGRAESEQGQQNGLYTLLTASPYLVDGGEASAYVKNVGFTATIGSGGNGPTNRLATVTRGGTLSVNGTNYATGISQTNATLGYDGNGNVTDDGTYTYTYDAFNRQVTARSKASGTPLVGQYFYDAAGERTAAIRYDSSGTAITYTQYLREGGQVVYERTWTISGSTLTPQTDKTYIAAGGRMAVTRQTVSGTTTLTYYATDHLGTVRSTVTATTGGTEQYRTFHDYEPFGLEIPTQDTVSPNTHRFTGQERDAETGNDFMHARYYGSNLARFMRPDPVNGKPADPQSFNLYAYVGNNPTNRTDPLGLMWFKIDGKWTFLKGVDKVINNTVDAQGKTHTKTVIGLDSLVTFDGKTLTLFQKDGTNQSFEARAGKVDSQGRTQPSLQGVKDVGPIPEGTWTFNPKEIQRYSDLNLWQQFKSHFGGSSWPGGTSSWGNERVWLKPETYQGPRDNFTIHGGDEFGSRGCIDLAKNGPAFFSAVDTTLDTIPVFVNYQ